MSWADIALGNTVPANRGGKRTAPTGASDPSRAYAGGSSTFNEAAGSTQYPAAPVNALAGLKPGGVPLDGGRSSGMVRVAGAGGVTAGGDTGMAAPPQVASQPGIDPSRLYSGATGSLNPNAPPIFRRSDITFNQANPGQESESGARIGASDAGWSSPFGTTDNMYISGTDPNSPNVSIKNGQYAGMSYNYGLDPTGQYYIPQGPGQQRQMGTANYGSDVWMPLALAATMGAGVYGAGAGAAAEGAAGGAGAAGAGAAPAYSGVGMSAGSGAGAGFGAEGATVGGAGAAGAGGATGATGGGAAGGGSGLGTTASGFFDNAGNWVPLANAAIGAIGANRAAGQQADAANRATQLQSDIYQQNRADLAPWRQAGGAGLSRLQYLLGLGGQNAPGGAGGGDYGSLMRDFGMSDYQADPGYQFRMQQGEQAINRNALANGRYNSGSVLRALQDFNSGLASQEYGNAFNRFQTQRGTRLNALQSLSGVGQSATNQTGQFGQNFANQAGSNMIGAGNAAAAGTVGGINAITGGLGQYLNYNQSQQQMQQQQQYNNAMLEALRGNNGGYGYRSSEGVPAGGF